MTALELLLVGQQVEALNALAACVNENLKDCIGQLQSYPRTSTGVAFTLDWCKQNPDYLDLLQKLEAMLAIMNAALHHENFKRYVYNPQQH